MKSVPAAAGQVRGADPAQRPGDEGEQRGDRDRDSETGEQGAGRTRKQRPAAPRTSARPSAAIATNSGPSTMAPMTRICESSDDRDARQQRRQGHEGQVGPVELGLLVGPLGDVGPDNRVGAAAGRLPLRVEPRLRDPRRTGLDVDRPAPAGPGSRAARRARWRPRGRRRPGPGRRRVVGDAPRRIARLLTAGSPEKTASTWSVSSAGW